MENLLTEVQKGKVAESLLISEITSHSRGRLSLFVPVADDMGIDFLVLDKKTRNTLPLQVKSRSRTIISKGRRTSMVHFNIREATFTAHGVYALLIFLDEATLKTETYWLIPYRVIEKEALHRPATKQRGGRFVVRANKSETAHDKWSKYKYHSPSDLVKDLLTIVAGRK